MLRQVYLNKGKVKSLTFVLLNPWWGVFHNPYASIEEDERIYLVSSSKTESGLEGV